MGKFVLIALFSISFAAETSAAEATDTIRSAVERCRIEQAAKAPRIGRTQDGTGFFKNQEMAAEYRLVVEAKPSATSPDVAEVEIKTLIANVTAPSEEAVRAMPLSVGETSFGLIRRYRFEFDDRRWRLVDAAIQPIFPTTHGLTIRTVGSKRIEPDAARAGSDAGPTCIRTIESAP